MAIKDSIIFILWAAPFLFTLSVVAFIYYRSSKTRIIVLPSIKPKESKKWWLTPIKNAKHKIIIVAGDLSKEVYNDPEVVETFKSKLKEGVDVKVLFGPEISRDDEGHNKFLDLFEFPNDSVLYSTSRQPFHFRVVDNKFVYFEKPHAINGPIRDVTVVDNSVMWSNRLQKFFKKLIDENGIECFDPEKHNHSAKVPNNGEPN